MVSPTLPGLFLCLATLAFELSSVVSSAPADIYESHSCSKSCAPSWCDACTEYCNDRGLDVAYILHCDNLALGASISEFLTHHCMCVTEELDLTPHPSQFANSIGVRRGKGYAQVQLVSYEVPTLFQTDALLKEYVGRKWVEVQLPDVDPDYVNFPSAAPNGSHPLSHAEYKDAWNRLKRLALVATEAHQRYMELKAARHPDVDISQTLKVFLAPEFLFRLPPQVVTSQGYNDTVYGAYSYNTMIWMVKTLHAMFTQQEWDDWLFVPGTIFSHQHTKKPAPSGRMLAQDPPACLMPANSVLLNTAVVIKGGDPGSPSFEKLRPWSNDTKSFSEGGNMIFTHKRYMSPLDGIPRSLVGLNKQLRLMANNESSNFFRLSNLTFAMEVCLDHAYAVNAAGQYDGVAKSQLASLGAAAPLIDVHLLVSAGMDLNFFADLSSHPGNNLSAGTVVSRVGGAALHVDGEVDRILQYSSSESVQIDSFTQVSSYKAEKWYFVPDELMLPADDSSFSVLASPSNHLLHQDAVYRTPTVATQYMRIYTPIMLLPSPPHEGVGGQHSF